MTIRKVKIKVPRAKERKAKGDQKGKEGDYKGKGKGADQKRPRCGNMLHSWKARTSC